MILMADSVEPQAIPAQFRAYANRGVAPYIDGSYAWHSRTIAAFPRHLQGIDVNGAHPELADVLDVERFDATPATWPSWRSQRLALIAEKRVHGWPKPYTSIAPGGGFGVKALVDATLAHHQELPQHWWIAWYVAPHIPTAAEVVAEIKRLTGLDIAENTIWGCQYQTGSAIDTSVIYQNPEWQ